MCLTNGADVREGLLRWKGHLEQGHGGSGRLHCNRGVQAVGSG